MPNDPTDPSDKKTTDRILLSNALESCINGDIYALKKTVAKGFDLSTNDYLCVTDAARLGHTHIVSYILEDHRPPDNILKELSTICCDSSQNETLKKIVRSTKVYSQRAINSAQYVENTQAIDYIMDREFYESIGNFYAKYKSIPQKLRKLLVHNPNDHKNGESDPLGFADTDTEILRMLQGIVYKNELSTMLQICCRETLKDAAEIFYLATEIQRELGIGFQNYNMLTDEERNSPLTFTVSFGSLEDYLKLKKENRFLQTDIQKNNLGYTIGLAIKNNNYKIAKDLITEGYCPDPQIIPSPTNTQPNMFSSVINNLINSDAQKDCNKLLNHLLERQHSQIDTKIKDLLSHPSLIKDSWDYTIKAIRTGKEDIARTLLKNICLKDVIKEKYYNSNPENYVLRWLTNYQNLEMVKQRTSSSPTLAI